MPSTKASWILQAEMPWYSSEVGWVEIRIGSTHKRVVLTSGVLSLQKCSHIEKVRRTWNESE